MTSAQDRLNQTLPGLGLLPVILELCHFAMAAAPRLVVFALLRGAKAVLLDAAARLSADVAAAVLPDAATRPSDLAAALDQTYLPWRETTVLFAPATVLRYQCRFAAQNCLSVALALFFNRCRPIGK